METNQITNTPISAKPAPRTYTRKDCIRARELQSAGKSHDEIAAEMVMPPSSVSYVLKKKLRKVKPQRKQYRRLPQAPVAKAIQTNSDAETVLELLAAAVLKVLEPKIMERIRATLTKGF